VENSTASFTYKVPEDAVGGEYMIKVYNYNMPPAYRKIRIREYEKDNLIIVVTLGQDSYRPGDNVLGQITVTNADGSPFQEQPTYTLAVSFEDNKINNENLKLSTAGLGIINF